MFTWTKEGRFEGPSQTTVFEQHTRPGIPPAKIESGPYVGIDRAQDDWPAPPINTATHRHGDPTPDGGWEVFALSAEEIDEKAAVAAKAAAVEKARSEAEAEFARDASKLTAEERIARLEKLVLGQIAKTDPGKIGAVATEEAVVKG
jgi:hypothetical protein